MPDHYEIYYKKSTDTGVTWSATNRLCKTSGDSWNPAITADSSNALHVVWNENTPGNSEIYYRGSAAGGSSWSAVKRLTWNPAVSFFPRLVIDLSNNIHVVWMDTTPGNYGVYYKRSMDGGVTWAIAKRLTWTSGDSYYPIIAVDSSGNLHLVWSGNEWGNFEIYYRKSRDAGSTWTVARQITWNLGNSLPTAIAADSSGNPCVVWQDNTPGNDEIYYKRSTDGGTTWSAAQRLTWNSGSSGRPAIAIDSSKAIHIVWADPTPGNDEIYYKKFVK